MRIAKRGWRHAYCREIASVLERNSKWKKKLEDRKEKTRKGGAAA